MRVQEIFNNTPVRSIETQILSLYHEAERHCWYDGENKKAITSLLEVRKRILNSMFVLDEQSKQLLAEFNEAMKLQLIEMRKRAIDLYNKVYHPDMMAVGVAPTSWTAMVISTNERMAGTSPNQHA